MNERKGCPLKNFNIGGASKHANRKYISKIEHKSDPKPVKPKLNSIIFEKYPNIRIPLVLYLLKLDQNLKLISHNTNK
jgi:hypothetical protein